MTTSFNVMMSQLSQIQNSLPNSEMDKLAASFSQLSIYDTAHSLSKIYLKNDSAITMLFQKAQGNHNNLSFPEKEALKMIGHRIRNLNLSGILLTKDTIDYIKKTFTCLRNIALDIRSLSDDRLSALEDNNSERAVYRARTSHYCKDRKNQSR